LGSEGPGDVFKAKTPKMAKEYVKGLLRKRKGQMVRLEVDVQERDKNGRLLAYVWIFYPIGTTKNINFPEYIRKVHRTIDEEYSGTHVDINGSIIKAGYAKLRTIQPNVKYAELFEKLYQEAREQGRGLWKKARENEVVSDPADFLPAL